MIRDWESSWSRSFSAYPSGIGVHFSVDRALATTVSMNSMPRRPSVDRWKIERERSGSRPGAGRGSCRRRWRRCSRTPRRTPRDDPPATASRALHRGSSQRRSRCRGSRSPPARRARSPAACSASPAASGARAAPRRRGWPARSPRRPTPGWRTEPPAPPALEAHQNGTVVVQLRPSTNVVRSAASSAIRRPVTYSARFSAWVRCPPMQPAAPLRAGSVRQSACLMPVRSNGVASQPAGTPPRSSAPTELPLSHEIAGQLDHRVGRCSCGSARTPRPDRATSSLRRHASAASKVIGLSQTTWMPASSSALAIGKCRWLGVTIETKSTRSPPAAPARARSSPPATRRHGPDPGAARAPSPATSPLWTRTRRRPAPPHRPAAAARRCTSPMKAPGPPPTMPIFSARSSLAMDQLSSRRPHRRPGSTARNRCP